MKYRKAMSFVQALDHIHKQIHEAVQQIRPPSRDIIALAMLLREYKRMETAEKSHNALVERVTEYLDLYPEMNKREWQLIQEQLEAKDALEG